MGTSFMGSKDDEFKRSPAKGLEYPAALLSYIWLGCLQKTGASIHSDEYSPETQR